MKETDILRGVGPLLREPASEYCRDELCPNGRILKKIKKENEIILFSNMRGGDGKEVGVNFEGK